MKAKVGYHGGKSIELNSIKPIEKGEDMNKFLKIKSECFGRYDRTKSLNCVPCDIESECHQKTFHSSPTIPIQAVLDKYNELWEEERETGTCRISSPYVLKISPNVLARLITWLQEQQDSQKPQYTHKSVTCGIQFPDNEEALYCFGKYGFPGKDCPNCAAIVSCNQKTFPPSVFNEIFHPPAPKPKLKECEFTEGYTCNPACNAWAHCPVVWQKQEEYSDKIEAECLEPTEPPKGPISNESPHTQPCEPTTKPSGEPQVKQGEAGDGLDPCDDCASESCCTKEKTARFDRRLTRLEVLAGQIKCRKCPGEIIHHQDSCPQGESDKCCPFRPEIDCYSTSCYGPCGIIQNIWENENAKS